MKVFQPFYISVNCTWGNWTWESCSKTCGLNGTQNGTRTISQPAKYGGTECEGPSTDIQNCNLTECLPPLPPSASGASECTKGWRKINQQENGVAWGAKDDTNGVWKVASDICGTRLMLVAISGSVNCELNFGKVDGEYTNFGCQLTGTWNHLGAYVTEGKGFQYAIVPKDKTAQA